MHAVAEIRSSVTIIVSGIVLPSAETLYVPGKSAGTLQLNVLTEQIAGHATSSGSVQTCPTSFSFTVCPVTVTAQLCARFVHPPHCSRSCSCSS